MLTPKTPSREAPSRVWFLGHGCRQVPLESTGGKVLWAHQDGYFLNARGQKLKHDFSPAKQHNRPNMHSAYPCMRQYGSKNCHHLMFEAYYWPRTKGMQIDHLNGILFAFGFRFNDAAQHLRHFYSVLRHTLCKGTQKR